MGGKSYYCDYCGCFLKNDINVRKTHNSGLTHKITKANFMRRYEDPRKTLMEESAKVPCTRFPKGFCKFGFYCQFSHYSASQLDELREIVKKLDEKSKDNEKKKSLSKLRKKRKRRRDKLNCKNLPPSLRKTNLKFIKLKSLTLAWG